MVVRSYSAVDLLSGKYIAHIRSHPVTLVIKLLSIRSHSARIVGGAVRDMLLDIMPQDYDVATTMLPSDVIAVLSAHNIHSIPTGIDFGSITALVDGVQIEITTLRKDIECFGRQAKVTFTQDYILDAKRRDFTINSISYCTGSQLIFDYFNGIEHLHQKKLVFIGDPQLRIQEDYLRIMRFFRFSGRYANHLDNLSLQACVNNIDKMVKTVSAERIKRELDLILINPINANDTIYQMISNRVLQAIFPAIKFVPKDTFNLVYRGIVAIELEKYNIRSGLVDMMYACLFLHNQPGALKTSLQAKRFANKSLARILSLVEFHTQKAAHIDSKYNYRSLFAYFWYQSNDFTQFVLHVVFVSFVVNIPLTGILECLDYFACKKKEPMPISIYDIIDRAPKKKFINNIKKVLEKRWVESNFSLTVTHLRVELDKIIDNL